MTALEIVCVIALWLIVGFWICYKRDWYRDPSDSQADEDQNAFKCTINVIFAPLSLIIAFIVVFIYDDWC
jgi:hypothetical protein